MAVKYYTDQIPPRSGRVYDIAIGGKGEGSALILGAASSTIKDTTIYDQEGSAFGAGDVNESCLLPCSYAKTGRGHELNTPNKTTTNLKFYATSDYNSGDKFYFNNQEMIVKAADGMTLHHHAFLANTLVSALRYENQLFIQIKSALSNYPIGSTYESFEETSPSYLFGGTWQRLEKVFTYATGVGESSGQTGGLEKVSLTEEENGPHTHYLEHFYIPGEGGGVKWTAATGSATSSAEPTLPSGKGKPHENMPPYITVHKWRRTA